MGASSYQLWEILPRERSLVAEDPMENASTRGSFGQPDRTVTFVDNAETQRIRDEPR